MKPAEYNIEVEQGSTKQISFASNDAEAFDFSNYDRARLQVRKTPSNTNVLFSTDDYAGSLTIDSENNKLILLIPANVTTGFTFTDAGYDLELEKDGSPKIVDKFCTGRFIVKPEYTKDNES